MNLYQTQHQFYCGIDLHANQMYACVVDHDGKKQLHRNYKTQHSDRFFDELHPYNGDLVVGCESTFNWYRLADACRERKIPFVLGHALYLKAIHGGKVKNDKLDSEKLALLLRGGNFATAYTYPRNMRTTRDLLRRRTVGKFLSYCRLVRRSHTSAGKSYGSPGKKIGNAHLKGAFGEAVPLLKRCCPEARSFVDRIERKHGKARAFSYLAVKLGRAVYHMLKRGEAFELDRLLR